MTIEWWVAVAAATSALGIGGLVLWRDPRPIASRAFALGMVLLAAREVAAAFSADALRPESVELWFRMSLVVSAGLPVSWLVFSLTYSRVNASEFLRKWRWVLWIAGTIPSLIVALGFSRLTDLVVLEEASHWQFRLGASGYSLQVIFLLAAVLILVNLESTLRAAMGSIRWQIKFLLMGVGLIFAHQVYLSSQAILFASVGSDMFLINAAVLLVANGMIVVSLVRSRLNDVPVYLSDAFLFNSITLLLVGTYLLLLGGLIEAMKRLGGVTNAPLVSFIVLLALLVLAAVLASNQFHQRVRGLVRRHLRRPSYDYQQIWTSFSEKTSALTQTSELAAAVTRIVAETFGCGAASVWLFRPGEKRLELSGSTNLSVSQGAALLAEHDGTQALSELCRDASDSTPVQVSQATESEQSFFRAAEIRYVAPLLAAREPLGYLTLNDRVSREPLFAEDLVLLKTFANQTAANILKLRLGEDVQKAREMETFQSLSTFFVHDLKNLANRLSLALQNLPVHYDNPEFRGDFLTTMDQSLQKIERMTGRLSSLSSGLDIRPAPMDLNALVGKTLDGFNGALPTPIERNLGQLPRFAADEEQLHRVVTNLVLNASEASQPGAPVHVETSSADGWVALSVSDTGCGMSKPFIGEQLFKPFQTTKKQGLGIGLFHTKKIVEAHGGRIEVESTEGSGTVFTVYLPIEAEE